MLHPDWGQSADCVHIHMLGESFGKCVVLASDDVDYTSRHIAGIEHLIEVSDSKWVALGGDRIVALPIAMAGASMAIAPSNACSSGQTIAITPIARGMAMVTLRSGV